MEDEATSFDDVMNEKKIYDVRDQIWNACNSLEQSIVSILLDKECEDKQAAIAQSIDQFKGIFRMMHPSLGSKFRTCSNG